jgi:uncharacterized protein (DUF3084 family)
LNKLQTEFSALSDNNRLLEMRNASLKEERNTLQAEISSLKLALQMRDLQSSDIDTEGTSFRSFCRLLSRKKKRGGRRECSLDHSYRKAFGEHGGLSAEED